MNRVSLSSLCVLFVGGAAAVVLLAQPAAGFRKFARKEGVECKECHKNPDGGGPRNTVGQYYHATQRMPLDDSPETKRLVESTVDRWMQELLVTPPVIRWTHTPLAELPVEPARTTTPAPDHALLRRLSLDLRGTSPVPSEVARLQSGDLTLEQAVDAYLDSEEFERTFMLYHKDIIRPRTGIFNASMSLSKVATRTVSGTTVYSSERLRTEAQDGLCDSGKRKAVSPWWDRSSTVQVCGGTAREDRTVKVGGTTIACDTEAGQMSGQCGCGPHLVYCYTPNLRDTVMTSMREEMARVAMEVVKKDLPYSEVLTADWSLHDGALEVFYARLGGTLGEVTDADIAGPWRRVERDPRHSGVLTTPAMLNFFYNGRRWSQRVLESFFCHEVVPDWDLLDDTIDAGLWKPIPYRDSPDQPASTAVTEQRACASCHVTMEPVARVKDRWDFFGQYFEKDPKGFEIPETSVFLGQEVKGVDGFGKALAGSEVFHDCVVNQVWEHMLGHRFLPSETPRRRELVEKFRANNLSFKSVIREIAKTPEYRAKDNLKLMTRELYQRAMGRATDVAWKVGSKSGWDVYYDKVGGMDYRKIEARDRRPGIGHSLVQFKGAAESCGELVTRELKRDSDKRVVFGGIDDLTKKPSAKELDGGLARLYLRAVARPYSEVSDAEKQVLRELFDDVGSEHGWADGWRAVCAAVFGSEDYALF